MSLGSTEMKVSACSARCDDIKLFVKSVDANAIHGNTLGVAETLNIDVRSYNYYSYLSISVILYYVHSCIAIAS